MRLSMDARAIWVVNEAWASTASDSLENKYFFSI